MRGFLQRKVNKKANEIVEPKPQPSHRSREKCPGGGKMGNKGGALKGNSFARELKEMPDHSNEETRKAEERLGPFIFDSNEDDRENEVVQRQPYELDNGAIYHGQWTKDGHREGKGT